MPSLGISQAAFAKAQSREERELRRRARALDIRTPSLTGATVILVDDGLATGATMQAAASAARRSGPKSIIVAVPVGARQAVRALRRSRRPGDLPVNAGTLRRRRDRVPGLPPAQRRGDAGPHRRSSAVTRRLTSVGDVDHHPLPRAGTVDPLDPHRQSGPDAEPDRRQPLEAAGEGDLAERRVARDIGELVRIGRAVGRIAVGVVRGSPDRRSAARLRRGAEPAEPEPSCTTSGTYRTSNPAVVAPAPLRSMTSRS